MHTGTVVEEDNKPVSEALAQNGNAQQQRYQICVSQGHASRFTKLACDVVRAPYHR
jgi:hypothetical protein